MSIQPYNIFVSPFVIEDLRERLGRARWPDELQNDDWSYGTNMSYLKDLCAHWGHGFDWKEQEEQLNSFPQFRWEAEEGPGLHFIHQKGKGEHTIPLLLIHGYPDSFVRYLKLIPLLTQEGANGISFDVIVPSIPGFGFSDRPSKPGMNSEKIAGLFARLMSELRYGQFIVHGGDWGSTIGEQLAIQFPKRLLGIHLTDVPYHHLFSVKAEDLVPAEKAYLQAGQQWRFTEGAYALLQSTKPQTLAPAVNDSPIGLASWIIEKFYSWTDCHGDLESVYTRDELLTNLTIYWVTQTAGSAFRIYYENRVNPPKADTKKIKVPAAFFMSAKDLVAAPREFAERVFSDVRHWNQRPSGGHFAALEQPEELAADLFRFAETVVAEPAA